MGGERIAGGDAVTCCGQCLASCGGKFALGFTTTLATMSRFFRAANDSSDSESSSSEEEELLSDASGSEAPAPAAPKKPMSRFLKTAGASSSSSSDDSDDDDDDSDASDKPAKKLNRFKAGAGDDSDSDDDAPRIVKSAKDRRLEEMQATGNAIDNALKINDWNAINNGESAR